MFLSVTAEERARISARAKQLKQAKKAVKKTRAFERKLILERERKRVTTISNALRAPTPPPAPENCHSEIATFLLSGRLFGDSHFENSAQVRKLCGDSRLWSAETRQCWFSAIQDYPLSYKLSLSC